MKMSSTVLCAVIFLAADLTFSAAQMSCKGQCGAEYYRGYTCQCDYGCMSYGECCKDYESQCTTQNSCRGRCGESFKRGRLCNCDPDCLKYKQCCPDYKTYCDAEAEMSGAASASAPVKTSSCHSVNNNKPKESTVTEAQQTSTLRDNPGDVLIPLVTTTSYPPADPNDDIFSQIIINDKTSPIPDGISGYGLPTADLLNQVAVEPTDSPDVSDLIDSTNDGTASPAPTTLVDRVSSQPSPTSAPKADVSPPASSTELHTTLQIDAQSDGAVSPDAQKTDATDAPSDRLEATTPPINAEPTQDNTAVVLDTTIPPSSMPDVIDIKDGPTQNPKPDDTGNNSDDPTATHASVLTDLPDLSTDVSTVSAKNLSEVDVLTTPTASSTAAVQGDVASPETTAAPVKVIPATTQPKPSEPPKKPQDKPDQNKPLPTKPSQDKPDSKPDTLNTDDLRDYQADDNNDTNLCSGQPIGAVTTLRNGTMVIFRGHYFWILNRNRVPGPAQSITQVWGVPSPIDTVFTRCNCQGKTYIFKGPQYWRYENAVLDPGYPKVIQTGFDGLRGQITAALSVPQYRARRESVFFFRRGGSVQKYSYLSGTSPTCRKDPPRVQYAVYTVRHRMARQAVSALGPEINIQTTWRGFPSTVTAAVSTPDLTEPEGYKYYVFSRSTSYNVRVGADRPVVTTPMANGSQQSNKLFKCPKKV